MYRLQCSLKTLRCFHLVLSVVVLASVALAGYVVHKRSYSGNYASTQPERSIQTTPSPPPQPNMREVVDKFRPNQTVTEALLLHDVPLPLINELVECARPVYDLAKVRARKLYWLYFTEEGELHDFRYPVDDERYLTVYLDEAQDSFVPVMKDFPFETSVMPVSGVVESSLFSSIVSLGEQDQLALDLADIFRFDIDFYTDVQKGDSFRMLVEKKYLNDDFAKYGSILAAAVTNGQKRLTAFRFRDESGKPAYYGPDGKAMKKSFLKSPLKFARISSRFSLARLHPILKIVRPHLGVDYAAPTGTPVQAVGAGTVESTGRSREGGNMVKLRHAGGYETMYLHLSKIAVRRGARVGQGDVIGYVGSTGLATGPHLDFRIARHGKFVNPLKVVFPPAPPVSGDLFPEFAALRDHLASQLAQPGE